MANGDKLSQDRFRLERQFDLLLEQMKELEGRGGESPCKEAPCTGTKRASHFAPAPCPNPCDQSQYLVSVIAEAQRRARYEAQLNCKTSVGSRCTCRGTGKETKRGCENVVILNVKYCEYYVEYTYTGKCVPERGRGEEPFQPEPGDRFYKAPTPSEPQIAYVVCDSGTCIPIPEPYHKPPQIYCLSNPATPCQSPCECMLLRASKDGEPPKWEPADQPDKDNRYPYDNEKYFYCCVCVRPEHGK